MNIKNSVMSLLAGASVIIASCNYQERKQQNFEKSFEQKWDESYDSLSRKELLYILQTNKDNLTDSMYQVYHHQIDQKPNTDTLIINMDRVINGPLGNRKLFPKGTKHIPATLGTLLGNHYDPELLYKYNPELKEILSTTQNLDWIGYKEIDRDIRVPAIYPDLEDFFIPSLDDFMVKYPEFKNLIGDDREVIIITRDEEDKYVTGYYVDGYISLAQYCAPGTKSHKSPEGVYYTNLNKDRMRYTEDSIPRSYYDKGDRRDSIKRSKKYQNTAMPYTTKIAKDSIPMDEMIHTRKVFIGKFNIPLSHGCLGQTGQIAMELFDRIDNRIVKVIIFNLYDKKQKLTTK